MISNPDNIIFESKEDIIDYIMKGEPPTEKQFARIIDMVEIASKLQFKDGSPIEGISVTDPETITNRITIDFSKMTLSCDEFTEILDRIYHNSKKHQKREIVLCTASTLIGLFIGLKI